jgi:hypothetical protein
VLNINAKDGQEKALKALTESVDGLDVFFVCAALLFFLPDLERLFFWNPTGTKANLGEFSELHALALVALAECKKAAEDWDGCIEGVEKAITTKLLKVRRKEKAEKCLFLGLHSIGSD